MSSHYKSRQPRPAGLIDKLVKCRYVNVGLFYLRQVFLAKFDLKVHTYKEVQDYTALRNNLRESTALVKTGQQRPGQAAFGHIVGGYDVGYCGYTNSLVFAANMHATVFKQDPLDPKRGQHYRKRILEPGGSRDELDSLKEILGRPPKSDAFMKALFGSAAVDTTATI